MKPRDICEEINGKFYFTVKHFAWATKRSEQSVRFLMCYGNRIRKLKVERIGDKPYIPYEELTEFPFTLPGRNTREVYHYTEAGVPTT
jgi:hypothetical protein